MTNLERLQALLDTQKDKSQDSVSLVAMGEVWNCLPELLAVVRAAQADRARYVSTKCLDVTLEALDAKIKETLGD